MNQQKNKKKDQDASRLFRKAKRDYEKIWEEVKPFVKKRDLKTVSTADTWKTYDT